MNRLSHRAVKRALWVGALAIAFVLGMTAHVPLDAQTVVSADGTVESTSGGFKFPDAAVLTTAPFGISVGDTGQTVCFDELGAMRACAGTGEDAAFRAGVSWPTPRFFDNGDGTITDHLTGLTWLQDANCAGDDVTWQDALDWIASFNTTVIACSGYTEMTFTDWRLPNANELQSLLDRGQSSPPLPSGHPFVSVQLERYWSSSSGSRESDRAWSTTMVLGELLTTLKTDESRVWPVRGGV